MGRNKCRDCYLNNRNLQDYCWDLEGVLKRNSKIAFELGLFAESVGCKDAARQFRDMGMLLGRSILLARLLETEQYRTKNRRRKRKRSFKTAR